MRYLLLSLVIAGTLLMGTPCFADTGVGISIPLTVTVTGGSSGGGGTYYGGGTPYVDPVRPFIDTTPQSSGSSYTPPQQTYIPVPEPSKVVTVVTPYPIAPNQPLIPGQDTGFTTNLVIIVLLVLSFLIFGFLWYRKSKRNY